MFEIRTTADWMQAVALAAQGEGEFDLDRLQDISDQWMQPREELEAQQAIIGAFRELMDAAGRY